MKIAAIPYQCETFLTHGDLAAKAERMLTDADADLVVLPEYAAMEAAMVGAAAESELDWRDLAANAAPVWVSTWAEMARKTNTWVLAGSGPVAEGGLVLNRSWLISASGEVAHQDKLILTPYERETLQMSGGNGLQIFDTGLGKIGVLICYDCEFPILAHALASAGADMILIPSCTDFPAGQTRVRQSARARAIENQCLVVQVPLVGQTSCSIVDQSTGRAGFFAPPDHGLPSSGILAEGETDSTAPVIWQGSPADIAAPRQSGQVGNFAHWDEQHNVTLPVQSRAMT